ncbi:hypothetical protein CXB51_021969 [Gossypium anomalum]|uniref:Zinc finger BED domain-containing protein RICESLEEPER 2-like n=1 Tax=Gossypium anomalum TaxID=47600 RepID=A0A8J5YJK2_9ROSI|nr:hypothetical protein CXB51_021969 [Gossypium anomalum]
MVLTAHWIDDEWKLQKRIINFFPISAHRGESIGQALEKCLRDWGIEKVFAITIDNASSNNVAVDYLRKKLVHLKACIANGKYIHMRCVAHIINKIVQEGVKDTSISVNRVRGVVRYIRASPSRLSKFNHRAEEEMVGTKAHLCLDVPTRWNSTYMMLNVAEKSECVFEAYVHDDHNFFLDLSAGYGVPTCDDWENVRRVTKVLEPFHELTLKYKKYWGDSKVMNLLIYLAVIFDPRRKINFLAFGVNLLFPTIADDIIRMVNRESYYLFDEYSTIVEGNHHMNVEVESNFPTRAPSSSENEIDKVKPKIGLVMQQYMKKKQRVGLESKSELDRYLGEDCENNSDSFDLLLWWKVNGPRFPIVAQMARDVLSVPISTVASKSVFCNAPTPETVAGVELEVLPNIIYQIKNFESFVSTFTAF